MDKVVFVLGYPITSIGKGTFSACLTQFFNKSSTSQIIKFDGVLNKDFSYLTNDEDIRSVILHDGTYGGYDFKTYQEICKDHSFSQTNLILGSQLLMKFIEERKNASTALRFIPHLSEFFIQELEERWHLLGKPHYLIIEVGGIIGDLENLYVMHAICRLKQKYQHISVCVLTPLLYNPYDSEIKTRVVQEALQKTKEIGLPVDYFLLRSHEKAQEKEIAKLSFITNIPREKFVLFPFVEKERIYDEIVQLPLSFLHSLH